MDQLRSQAERDHWILEASSPGTLFLREAMDLGTYYPAEVRVSLEDGPGGQELKVRASSEGQDFYYDSHLRHLVDELVSKVGVRPVSEVEGPGAPPAVDGPPSDLEMLTRLFDKGLLSEREFEMAKARATCR